MVGAQNPTDPVQGSGKKTSLTELVEAMEKNCQSCMLLTPVICISGCKTWRLKNQFRRLYGNIKDSGFMVNLLNTLKNRRRLEILGMISRESFSVIRLQKELKKVGFDHSQQTIAEEYLNPLMGVGLVEENQNVYHATMLGVKVWELLEGFHDCLENLPPHSECHEEVVLNMLMRRSRTFRDLEKAVSPRSVARVLGRLQRAALVETSGERDYVFFFRTRRDPDECELSPTERRVYEAIAGDGISASKLAYRVGISLRRTYRYLRRLKGKKMVFVRKRPISYSLTQRGLRVVSVLESVRNLILEAFAAAALVVKDERLGRALTLGVVSAGKSGRDERVVPLTVVQLSLDGDDGLFEK
jgi:predicted transcriptional regulator